MNINIFGRRRRRYVAQIIASIQTINVIVLYVTFANSNDTSYFILKKSMRKNQFASKKFLMFVLEQFLKNWHVII